jgi:hypothetical protein
LAGIRSAGGPVRSQRLTRANVETKGSHARYVITEVIVRHDADVSAGKAEKKETIWDRLVTFSR